MGIVTIQALICACVRLAQGKTLTLLLMTSNSASVLAMNEASLGMCFKIAMPCQTRKISDQLQAVGIYLGSATLLRKASKFSTLYLLQKFDQLQEVPLSHFPFSQLELSIKKPLDESFHI